MSERATPAIWMLTGDIMGPLGGGFRQQRWCEYILARGEPVRLFHVEGAFGVRYADVHSVEELRERRHAWIAAAPPRAGVRDSKAARVFRLLKHVFLLDLVLPSVFRLVTTVNAMLRRDAPPHVVLMCSVPPYAMALVGRILKTMHGDRVTMALDMRDLWSLHTAFPGPKGHKRRLERWVIGGADIFTTVAPALAERFARLGPRPDVVFNVATHAPAVTADPGSFDWASIDPQIRRDSRKIVYTGSIPAGFYDLDALLDAIEAFAGRPEAAGLQFVFVGAGGELAGRTGARHLPPGLVVFAPQVRHETAAAMQAAADALMFLGYRAADNQGQVSIKLFEYFRRGRPILPVHIRAGSDVAWLVRHYSGKECPHLLDTASLADAFVGVAISGGSSLPVATDVPAREASLLQAYEDVSDRIVARVRKAAA